MLWWWRQGRDMWFLHQQTQLHTMEQTECALSGRGRCSDDIMHLNVLEWHSASVYNRRYNHLKISIPTPKNWETNHIVVLPNRFSVALCSLFSMACHLVCDPPHAIDSKAGQIIPNIFEWTVHRVHGGKMHANGRPNDEGKMNFSSHEKLYG